MSGQASKALQVSGPSHKFSDMLCESVRCMGSSTLPAAVPPRRLVDKLARWGAPRRLHEAPRERSLRLSSCGRLPSMVLEGPGREVSRKASAPSVFV